MCMFIQELICWLVEHDNHHIQDYRVHVRKVIFRQQELKGKEARIWYKEHLS